jgi:hypothetical protein
MTARAPPPLPLTQAWNDGCLVAYMARKRKADFAGAQPKKERRETLRVIAKDYLAEVRSNLFQRSIMYNTREAHGSASAAAAAGAQHHHHHQPLPSPQPCHLPASSVMIHCVDLTRVPPASRFHAGLGAKPKGTQKVAGQAYKEVEDPQLDLFSKQMKRALSPRREGRELQLHCLLPHCQHCRRGTPRR